MKSYVFVFVPVQFQERLRDCLASIPEPTPEPPASTTNESYPFWTWFVPNPFPPPAQNK